MEALPAQQSSTTSPGLVYVSTSLAQPYRLLRRVQVARLLIAGAFDNTSRVAVCVAAALDFLRRFLVDLGSVLRVDVMGVAVHRLMAVRLLRVVRRLTAVENQDVLVRPHGHLLRVQMARGVALLPDPLIPQISQVAASQHLVEWRLCEQSHSSVLFHYAVSFAPERLKVNRCVPLAVCSPIRQIREKEIHASAGRSRIPSMQSPK